jgi:hypothetical protein
MNHKVKTTSSKPYPIAFLCFLSGLLSACTSLPAPKISKDKAIEIAIDACKIPHLVLVSEPKNIRTKLTTLGEADKLTGAVGETDSYLHPLDTRVWLIQMDGQLQIVGGHPPAPNEAGQAATPTPTQPFWGTCTVVLDANSGELIFTRGTIHQ